MPLQNQILMLIIIALVGSIFWLMTDIKNKKVLRIIFIVVVVLGICYTLAFVGGYLYSIITGMKYLR